MCEKTITRRRIKKATCLMKALSGALAAASVQRSELMQSCNKGRWDRNVNGFSETNFFQFSGCQVLF